ncbi:hypothetical protein [Brevundimonas sp. SGAir0440]|uniref:hypothetical protein n=1 Tax=Brevundimonas sp. SGAir0440 TaxID=2579977 RepID=UPI001AEFFA97|nr:hypothetical protein [Brevundimonas sp. SGAir0440]
MLKKAHVLAVLAVLLLLVPFRPAIAQSPSPLDGLWVWAIDDHAAFVLRIDCDGAGRPGGNFSRPAHFTLDANTGWIRLMNVVGPTSTKSFQNAECGGDEFRFSVQDGDTPTDVTAYVVKLVSADGAALTLANIPGGPTFDLHRSNSPVSVFTGWQPDAIYGRPPSFVDNAALAALFQEDQDARQGNGPLAPDVSDRDRERRSVVRNMLDAGQIRSGADYYRSAFIFQHGDKPEDYLLAHALATAAVARGRQDAIWIATATLDRFLQSIGRAQVYGTQFVVPFNGDPPSQGAYDTSLLPDTLRNDSGVPSLAEQQSQLEAYRQRGQQRRLP